MPPFNLSHDLLTTCLVIILNTVNPTPVNADHTPQFGMLASPQGSTVSAQFQLTEHSWLMFNCKTYPVRGVPLLTPEFVPESPVIPKLPKGPIT